MMMMMMMIIGSLLIWKFIRHDLYFFHSISDSTVNHFAIGSINALVLHLIQHHIMQC